MIDYLNDRYGKLCLTFADRSKGEMKFGAVLIKGRRMIGGGWNRLSTEAERKTLTHVDYAIHAEQAAIYDALYCEADLNGARLYILGYAKNHSHLSVREGAYFTCRKCPHTLIKFNIPVMIPTPQGWKKLSPELALESAKQHKGHWQKFIKDVKQEKIDKLNILFA
jgi:hypothetical protein